MTRAGLREYAALQRERYLRAPRAEKRRLLDEVVTVSGLHRKAAIRLLRRPLRPPGGPRSGRPRVYGPAVAAAAQLLSEATGHIGPHRWHPFLPELLDRLTRSGDLVVPLAVDKQLRQVSPATLARLLAPFRAALPSRGLVTTHPGAWLKHEIPVRTLAEWSDAQPGFLELDLVAHCGPTTRGFFLCTLCAVDVATAWVELQAVWGKGQLRVGTAIHHVRQRLPMPLRGVDSDNGSEFINHGLYAWCQREGITFTRSRPYQKNDSAHVEQKNGAIVRPLIGYDRYASRAAYAQLARVYELARLHIKLKEQKGRRLRLTDEQRRRLAAKGRRLGRRVLGQVATIVTPDTILILCPAEEEMLYPAVRKRWQEEMAGRGERGGPSPSMRGLVDQRTNTFRAPGGSIADCPGRQENGAEGSRESRPPEGRYKANLAVHTSPGRARPRLSGRRR